MNQKDEINIDDIVDYKTEYSSRLQKVTVERDELKACCPFHDEKTPSFHVELKSGKFHCFGCGVEGNYVKFRAQLDRTSTKEAYKKICAEYNIQLPSEKKDVKPSSNNPVSYTVKEYALEKRLPEEWLSCECGLKCGKDKDGSGYIYIPYLNTEGVQAVFRKRYYKGHDPKFKWQYGTNNNDLMYGEWKIQQYYEDGYAIVAEGESDAQTLWYLGLNALGCPGASMMRAEKVARFGSIPKLYFHIEPDNGGEIFKEKTLNALKEGKYTGEVYFFSCKGFDVKDPSDLYIKYGQEAKSKIVSLMRSATKVDVYAVEIPKNIPDAPVRLSDPNGWKCRDKGIIMEVTNSKTGAFAEKVVCRTPIIITQRFKSLDTGEEKIEIAFKRDGKWSTHTFLRSTIFQSKNIVTLADMGCTITSENARFVVRFLGELEAENIDIISLRESTSTFGWQTRGRFVPGMEGDIHLDIAPSMQNWASGYSRFGTQEDWIEQMREARNNFRFRFILASAFAAPLLKSVRCRNFMVYNWADSKGGKTAALKAALSVWGNPERIMATFNATQVALERMAGIFNDLPMGLDERQLAGSKMEFLEKIVYMLANGSGKIRGSKAGDLQEHRTWRSIVIATGEEPIINDRSMDGVSTRLIEIPGAPFEDTEHASAMHKAVLDNYGWAGPEFVKKLLKIGNEKILGYYRYIEPLVAKACKDKNKLPMLTTVAIADAISSRMFWAEGDIVSCIDDTVQFIKQVVEVMTDENSGQSTNENAAEYLNEWLSMKERHFSKVILDAESNEPREVSQDAVCDLYGQIDKVNDVAYVFSTVIKEALEQAKFNHRKTMKYLSGEKIIKTDPHGKFAIVKKISGKPMRMVAINLKRLVDKDADDDDGGGLLGCEVHEADMPFE